MPTQRCESRFSSEAMRPRIMAAFGLWVALVPFGAVGASGSTLTLQEDSFEIIGATDPFESSWRLVQLEEDLLRLDLRLEALHSAVPPEFVLRWRVPSIEIDAFWNPNIQIDRANFYRNRFTSRSTNQAPVFSLIDGSDRNRLTVGVSDALNRLELKSYLKEEDAYFYCEVKFFSEDSPARIEYEVSLRLDGRPIHFAEALGGVANWWASDLEMTPAAVPDAARRPMYSTWYSFHQNLDPDAVLAEVEVAKTLGYEAVIVDDGWQTLDSSRGYAYTGDWQPERIPEMKAFVERVHELGMDFLLWYSMPFVGEKAESYASFEGKFLSYWESQGTYVLDPRYPEVREHIIATYETALREWKVDGFKLDFLDRFVPGEATELTAAEGRDNASVDAAVDRLMTDVLERLRQIEPEIMIEFRQRYIGPLMRRYGNMFRAVDCPNNATANRAETTDLRLLAGNTAVHSDMVMWHPEDPVEHAALQLLNVLFSVPQLSVRLTQLPDDHLEMVQFWTRYWIANRQILLDGEFVPSRPSAVFPILRAEGENKTVVGLYEEMVVQVSRADAALDVVNATSGRTVVLRLGSDLGERDAVIFDAQGQEKARHRMHLDGGLVEFEVPPSGLLSISGPVSP